MSRPGPILVCGLGQVGYRVVSLLRQLGEPACVVTIGARDEWRRSAEERGARVLLGDARDASVLREAGLFEARALLALTNHDLVNVEIALDSRRLRPDLPVVVRLFDQELARHLEKGFGVRRALGVSALAAPTFAAAALGERWVGSFAWAGGHYVIGRLPLALASPLVGRSGREAAAREGLALVRYAPSGEAASGEAGPLTILGAGGRATVVAARPDWDRHAAAGPSPDAKALKRTAPPPEGRRAKAFLPSAWRSVPLALRTAVVVLFALIAMSVGVFRVSMGLSPADAFYFVVTTVTTTGYGDITPLHAGAAVKIYACLVMVLGSAATALLYSIITDFVVQARFREILGRERVPRAGHVIVAGLGNVGYRTVEELLRAGAEVAVIARDESGEFIEAVRGRVPVVAGDARLRDVLVRAGVESAAAIVAATGDDAVNLGIALAARELSPRIRTDVRLFDADFARKARSAFSLDAAMSASLLAAPMFVASALDPGVVGAFVEDDLTLIVLRVTGAGGEPGEPPSGRPSPPVVLRRRPGERARLAALEDGPYAADEELVVVEARALSAS